MDSENSPYGEFSCIIKIDIGSRYTRELIMRRDDDLFMIQVRLFRLFQQKWDLSTEECDKLFNEYDINGYIATCYEEYHVQGDDADLADIEKYIEARKNDDI